ncbi:hypothetical protein J437_LFUL004409, partial [Ladona fulva]
EAKATSLFSFSEPSTPEWPAGKILSLNRLSYCRIAIRRYHHDAPQMCHRCSRFGHSSSHCFAVPRCFRCAGPHLIADCPLTKEDTPTCCNCGGTHAAVSRNCTHWKQARTRQAAPAPLPTPTALPRPQPLPPKRNAWKTPLSFIPPQVAREAPPKRLDAEIPVTSAYRTTNISPEDFPDLPRSQPLTKETAAALKIPLRQRRRTEATPSNEAAPAPAPTQDVITTPLIILSWNARGGIGRKTPELINLLVHHSVDVALIQETHLKPWHRWTAPGYAVLRTDRTSLPGDEERQGGGTAILISDRLTFSQPFPRPESHHGMESTMAIIARRYLDFICLSSSNIQVPE